MLPDGSLPDPDEYTTSLTAAACMMTIRRSSFTFTTKKPTTISTSTWSRTCVFPSRLFPGEAPVLSAWVPGYKLLEREDG